MTGVLLLAPAATGAAATDLSIFGPERYDRLQGGPTIYTTTFERCEPSDVAVVRVWNGEDKASRMTAAEVYLNGAEIFSEQHFKQREAYLEALIPVEKINDLHLVLKSGDFKVPAFLRVEVVGKNCDATPPVISSTEPGDGSLLNTSRPQVSAAYVDENKGSGVDVDTVRLLVDGQDVTNSSQLGPAEISYDPEDDLPEGTHAVLLEVSDRAANVARNSWRFTTDTVPPQANVTSHFDGQHLNTPLITLSGDLDDSSASLAVRGLVAPLEGNHFSLADLPLSEGENVLAWQATDPAGNSSAGAITLHLDTVPPQVAVTSHATGTFLGTPTIDLTGSLNEAVLEVTVNGRKADLAEGVFSLSGIGLVEGVNTFAVVAVDKAGNVGTTSLMVNLDTVSPELRIVSHADGLYLPTPRIDLSGTVNEPVLKLTVNGLPAVVEGGTFSLSGLTLAEGPNTLTVMALDRAGNSGSAAMTLHLDTVPPVIGVSSPQAGAFFNTPWIAIAGTVNEPILSATVSGTAANLDSQGFRLEPWSLLEGSNTLVIQATDRAGNESSVNVSVVLDTAPPQVTFLEPVDRYLTNSSQIFVQARTDEPILAASVNGSVAQLGEAEFSLGDMPLEEGEQTLVATVIDRAGNVGSAAIRVTLDSVAPVRPLLAPTASPTNLDQTTVTGRAEPFSTVKVLVQRPQTTAPALLAAVNVGGEGEFLLENITLTEGKTIFTATAIDAAGNESELSDALEVELDTVPPVIAVSTPKAASYSDLCDQQVTGTLSEPATLILNGQEVPLDSLDFNHRVTLEPGENILTLTAVDLAGNAATVSVVVHVDNTPPEVTLGTPRDGLLTPRGTVTVSGSINEEQVTASLNGQPLNLTNGTFSREVLLAEGENLLSVVAVDRAGNVGSAQSKVVLDSLPPAVTLQAPSEGDAGANIELTVEATDSRGLSLVEVSSGGATLWSASPGGADSSGRTLTYTLSPSLVVGDTVTLRAQALDRVGNTGSANATLTVANAALGSGYLTGEVYDDRKGLRLAEAGYGVWSEGMLLASGRTDARGELFLELPPGEVLVRFTKPGFSQVDRQIMVLPEQKQTLLDARLTPIPSIQNRIGPLGGSIVLPLETGFEAQLLLEVPAGALSEEVDLGLTAVSNQGLAGRMPQGWSPLAAFDLLALDAVDASALVPAPTLTLPAVLQAPLPEGAHLSPDSRVTLAFYDRTERQWTAVAEATVDLEKYRLTAEVTGMGQFALVVADPVPSAPPPAAVGQGLNAAVASGVDYSQVSVSGHVMPPAAPPLTGLCAVGELILTPQAGLDTAPFSGLVLSGRVTERFDLQTGETVQPADYVQDLILYRTPCITNPRLGHAGLEGGGGTVRTTFPVTPSREFTLVDLLLGKVGVEIRPGSDAGGDGVLVGEAGARLVDAAGHVLEIPAGALTATVPVTLRAAEGIGALVGDGWSLLGAVEIDLSGLKLQGSAELSVPAPAGLDPGLPVLIARRIEAAGVSRLKLTALGRLSGSQVVSVASLTAVNQAGEEESVVLPGISASGTYLVLQAEGPMAYLKGTVRDASGHPFADALVVAEPGALVDLSNAEGHYLVAVAAEPQTLEALDLVRRDRGGVEVDPRGGQLLTVDLTIVATPPQVVAVDPANGALHVPPSQAVTVAFSEPVARSSVTSVVLADASGNVIPGIFSFGADGRSITLYPLQALASETLHRLTVSQSVRDLQGYPLGQDVTSSFTVRDTTPPPLPPAGSITATFPDEEGMIQVTGTQGSAESNNAVLVINDSSGEIVTVQPGSNGSFSARISAQLGDEVQVVLMDEAGNQTLISYLTFKAPDGRYLVTRKGGKVEGEGGSLLKIPDGALVGPAVVRLTQVHETELPHAVPAEAAFLAAVKVDTGGVTFQKEVDISVPVPEGMPEDVMPFMARPEVHVNADGSQEEVYVIVDSVKVVNGRLTTASPPFPGPMGFGTFAFLYAVSPVAGPVVVSGTTYRDMDGSSSFNAGDLPIRGAVVRSPGSWNFIGYSDSKGRYAAYGFTATGACRNFDVTAIHPLTMFRNSVNLTTCDAPYIVSDLNFKLADAGTEIPDTAAPEISVGLKVAEGQESKMLAGTVPVGTELTVPVSIIDREIASTSLTVEFSTPLMTSPQAHSMLLNHLGQELHRPMSGEEPAVYRYDFQPQFSGILAESGGLHLGTPQAGTYTVLVEAVDGSGNRSAQRAWVRAIDPGETPEGIDGSPQVDELLPANGARDVMVNSLVTAIFSEPVENVTQNTFRLVDLSTGLQVPAYVTSRLEEGRMVATLAPRRNLYYDREYEAILTREIRDAYDNLTAPSARMPLDREYRAAFRTKIPRGYDLAEEEQFSGGFDIAHFTSHGDGRTFSYVTAKEHGWRVIDVTDPTVPKLVLERNLSGPTVAWSCRGVAVDQQTAMLAMTEDIRYAAGGQYGYVRFYGLHPHGGSPALVGKEKLAENFSGIPGRVALYGRFAYVATVGGGLQVVDVEAARAHTGSADGSTIVGTFDTAGQGYGHPSDILIYPRGRALLTTTTGHLLLLDLSLPQVPRLTRAFKPEGFHAARVGVAAGYVYSDSNGFGQEMDLGIVTGRDGLLRTLDLTDPYNPEVVGTGVDEFGNQVHVFAMDLVVSSQAGLVFVTTFNAVLVFDVRDPARPILLARITELPGADGQMIPIGAIPALVEKGGWVFMADRDQGFRALDLDPVSIRLEPRVVILDKDFKPLQETLNYDIFPKDAYVSRIEVGLFEAVEGGAHRKVQSLTPLNNPLDLNNAVSLAGLNLEEGKAYFAQVLVNEGTGQLSKSEIIPFIQQAVLIPDYDHDRQIDPEDRERARQGKTFYFWTNDDDDWGETKGSDVPGDKGFLHFSLDYEDDKVDGVRDLIDFFPLLLDLHNLVGLFPPHQYDYLLKSEEESVNIVLTDLGSDEAGFYLVGDGHGPDRAYPFGEADTHHVTKEGLNLYNAKKGEEFFSRLLSGDGKGVVLVEGRTRSSLPLHFEILDADGNKHFWTELTISLDGVEQMFRHKNLIQKASDQAPEAGTKWGEEDRLGEPSNCPDLQCLNADGSDFVFVHGYNVDGQQARGWQAEMFKRMFWSGSRARFWGVSWYGSETQLLDLLTVNYQTNIQHAFQTAPAFRTFLNGKVQGPISIAAHSLGNMLVSSCLSDQTPTSPLTADVRNYFLIDAAVALEAYTGGETPGDIFDSSNPMVHPDWYGYASRLGASEWHRLFEEDVLYGEPDARQTLTWRDRFADLPEGISYFNFYSSGEEVLAFHDGDPDLLDGVNFSEPGRAIWALQELHKGRTALGVILSSRYGGWGFNWGDYVEKVKPDTEEEEERIWLPITANAIQEINLKTKPFFNKGLFSFGSLFESVGPGNTQVMERRDEWLAEAFPTLTGATGGPDGGEMAPRILPENVFDMQGRFQNGWPKERIEKEIEGWRHSDLKNVAFLYIYEIFKKMIQP